MFFFSVVVVVPWILAPHGADSAFSMCQSLDLEVARARRIQAIRGQILSKLQLETPPKDDGAPHPLPPEVMLLFNNTQELVRQLATCEGRRKALRQDEEYYAKEVWRVDMLTLGHADNSIPGPFSTPFFRFLHFDLSVAPHNFSHLVQAELRIYQVPNPGSHANEQHVELYQVMQGREPSAPTQRYVGSRSLLPRHRAEWVSFEVTDSVRRWLRSRGLDDVHIKEAWKGWSRPPDLTRKDPHLILTLLPPNQEDFSLECRSLPSMETQGASPHGRENSSFRAGPRGWGSEHETGGLHTIGGMADEEGEKEKEKVAEGEGGGEEGMADEEG
ncbi:hypothetical protein Chor_005175 [Crotalus horridus]